MVLLTPAGHDLWLVEGGGLGDRLRCEVWVGGRAEFGVARHLGVVLTADRNECPLSLESERWCVVHKLEF